MWREEKFQRAGNLVGRVVRQGQRRRSKKQFEDMWEALDIHKVSHRDEKDPEYKDGCIQNPFQ